MVISAAGYLHRILPFRPNDCRDICGELGKDLFPKFSVYLNFRRRYVDTQSPLSQQDL